jgi:hypothetical protein
VLIFSRALAVVEVSAILWFFTKLKSQNVSGPMLPPGERNWQLIYPNLNDTNELTNYIKTNQFNCFKVSLCSSAVE